MAKQGLFVYKGRGNTADAVVRVRRMRDDDRLARRCTAASSKNAKFAYGISTLPYYPDVPGAPQNTVIGGASLWVMAGKKPEEYKGVAAFFNYLSKPEVPVGQPQAHRLPAGHHGRLRADRQVRLLQGEPGHRRRRDADDPQDDRQVARHPPRQLRPDPHRSSTRKLEQVWAGKKTAKEALDAAVKRGNEQLERFQKAQMQRDLSVVLRIICVTATSVPGFCL